MNILIACEESQTVCKEFRKKGHNAFSCDIIDCDKICIENPVGVMTRYYQKPTQYIKPCQFGHPTGKRTGLWLKNLAPLKPTKIVDIEYHTSGTGRKWDKWFGIAQ